MTSAEYLLNLSVRETSPVDTANCRVYYKATVSRVLQQVLRVEQRYGRSARVEQQYGRIVRTEQKQEHITRVSTWPRAYKVQAFGPLCHILQLPQR